MDQSASPRAGSRFRRILVTSSIVVGAVVGIVLTVALIVATVREAMQPGDFRQKFLLSAMDKLILGGVVVLVGYWFQKRLEVFKRDQAFASELAKARIAAYHRAFAAVSSLDYAGHGVMHVAALVVAPGSQEEMERAKKLEAKSAVYLDEITKTTSQLAAERYLLGDSFCKAVGHYIERLAADVERFVRSGQPEKEERARMKVERDRIREAVALYLPPFARAPTEDLHFSNPDADSAYSAITGRDLRAPKK